jgi:hypothetical protein
MSETAHIRNLLKKSVNSKPSNVSNDSINNLPRFGLRGAAAQIIDSLYELVFDSFEDHQGDKVLAKLSMYADSDESFFYSTAGNIEDCLPSFQGDFFESFPDLFITIYISNDHIYGTPPPATDAVYAHAGENEYDMGEIEVRVYLPPTLNAALGYLKDCRLEVCGTLAHEMQHVVQKHCYGESLGNAETQSVLSHALDKNEIDARVEEIIAAMEEGYFESDKAYFEERLIAYVEKYLQRNVTESTVVPNDIKETMIFKHLEAYDHKMRGIL